MCGHRGCPLIGFWRDTRNPCHAYCGTHVAKAVPQEFRLHFRNKLCKKCNRRLRGGEDGGCVCELATVPTASRVACEFIDTLAATCGWASVRHVHFEGATSSGTEFAVGRKHVDGYYAPLGIVIEFLGDFWHGLPMTYAAHDVHPVTHQTYGHMYQTTMQRLALLAREYVVVYIWEYKYLAWKRGGRRTDLREECGVVSARLGPEQQRALLEFFGGNKA